MLLVVKKAALESSASKYQLLGFAAFHHFYRYPESTRLRISQVGPLLHLELSISCVCTMSLIYVVIFFEASLYILLHQMFDLLQHNCIILFLGSKVVVLVWMFC
jgi:hypothetical protein